MRISFLFIFFMVTGIWGSPASAYKIPLSIGSGPGTTADAYVPVAQTYFNDNVTEAHSHITMRTAGTFSNFAAHLNANSATGAANYYFRVNGVDGNQTLNVPAGSTGRFTDSTNTDTVAVGDEVSIRVDRGSGGSSTIQQFMVYFEPADNDIVVKVAATGSPSFTAGSVTRYFALAGDIANNTTTETGLIQHPILEPVVARNMFVYVSSNTRTSTTTIRSRVNGANGNQVITIPAGATGIFEDTTNSDTLAIGDVFNSAITMGAGANSIVIETVAYEMDYAGKAFQMFSGYLSGSANTGITERFFINNGTSGLNGAQSGANMALYGSGFIRNGEIWVSANASTADMTCNVRNGSTNQSIQITIPAGLTGSFTDSTNKFAFTNGQNILWRCIKSNTGSLTTNRFTFVVEFYDPQAAEF